MFSWLDKDGDHICADHSAAGRAVVFHQSCRTSFYRKHADALRHGISGPLGYRIVKVSLSRVRSAEFWAYLASWSWCASSPKDPVIATSPAYHDHPPQRLLQNFPDTTRISSLRDEGRGYYLGINHSIRLPLARSRAPVYLRE